MLIKEDSGHRPVSPGRQGPVSLRGSILLSLQGSESFQKSSSRQGSSARQGSISRQGSLSWQESTSSRQGSSSRQRSTSRQSSFSQQRSTSTSRQGSTSRRRSSPRTGLRSRRNTTLDIPTTSKRAEINPNDIVDNEGENNGLRQRNSFSSNIAENGDRSVADSVSTSHHHGACGDCNNLSFCQRDTDVITLSSDLILQDAEDIKRMKELIGEGGIVGAAPNGVKLDMKRKKMGELMVESKNNSQVETRDALEDGTRHFQQIQEEDLEDRPWTTGFMSCFPMDLTGLCVSWNSSQSSGDSSDNVSDITTPKEVMIWNDDCHYINMIMAPDAASTVMHRDQHLRDESSHRSPSRSSTRYHGTAASPKSSKLQFTKHMIFSRKNKEDVEVGRIINRGGVLYEI